MKCYVDSSVILRYLLTDDTGFERVREFDKVGSSELLSIECRRVLHRYRTEGEFTDAQLADAVHCFDELYAAVFSFEMTPAVKNQASGAFPTTIGTLNAIHLATARLWAEDGNEPLVVFTFDQQMKTCAGAMGLHSL